MKWCEERAYPVSRETNPRPDVVRPPFEAFQFVPPVDSGAKVQLARFLYSKLEPLDEGLAWLGGWNVWPSSEHVPLVTRFRQALGEHQALIETPGHLFVAEEADDVISIITIALLFVWDCHVLTTLGRDALFVTHDEVAWFASRDLSVTERVGKEISQLLA